MTPRKTTVLVHAPRWKAGAAARIAAEGIIFSEARDAAAFALYENLCRQYGIDDGEPFEYGLAIQFDSNHIAETINVGDPYSIADRLCNLLAAATASAPGMGFAIVSSDDYRTADFYQHVWGYRGQTEFLMGTPAVLTDDVLDSIARSWTTTEQIRRSENSSGRVQNALTWYYYAWTSHYIDQVCLNLALVLELLFAPHHQGEIAHQVAFNTARYIGVDRKSREVLYRTVKRFYGVRSQVVHGGIPTDDKLLDPTIEMFAIVSRLLTQILTAPEIARLFDEEPRRKAMLADFLFE